MKTVAAIVGAAAMVGTAHSQPDNSTCIEHACTTHCNPDIVDACCKPLVCAYDPVFSDTRCIPKPPLICEPSEAALPSTMEGFAANSRLGALSASYSDDLAVPAQGSIHEAFENLPANSTCEVIIKVMASSVNPSDIEPSVGRKDSEKVVLGSDVAGVVVATQDTCTRLKVGTAVWGDIGANAHLASSGQKTKELGGYAQYAVALESQLGIKPDKLSFEQAGSLPKVALTSYKALVWYAAAPWKSAAKDGNFTVLVLGGSGGTGTTGTQLAKYFGATNIITTCGADNFDYCRANGADQVSSVFHRLGAVCMSMPASGFGCGLRFIGHECSLVCGCV